MSTKIVIMGAGISGLAAAYWLHKDGFDVTVLEKSGGAGGTMETVREGGFLFDRGPNSGLETTPLIGKLVHDAGLQDEMVYADETGNKRYILRRNSLHALPAGPGSFIMTRLFSPRAKLRLLAEPFIGRSDDGYYQSVAQFVRRRLGNEFLDYAVNPFVAGVFAGDPEKLSVKSAFPKLFRLEEEYGGLLKGMVKGARERKRRTETSKQSAKMFSFRSGMQTLPRAIGALLKDSVVYNADVTAIERSGGGYLVRYRHGGREKTLPAAAVISTVPAYAAAGILKPLDETLSSRLASIYYPPVLVLFLGYEKSAIRRPLDGFGFLIPEKEQKKFLGAIWSSVLFPGRAREGCAAFTLFTGGARSPGLLDGNRETLVRGVIDEFQEIMDIAGQPVFRAQKFWKRAIPQYHPGYIEHIRYFERFEREHPGIFLSGNYRDGIAVGDCIRNAGVIRQRVIDFCPRRQPFPE